MPASQKLIVSIDDDGGSPPDRFVVVVKASGSTTGGTPTQLAKLYLTPNSNGKAFFDLSQIADPVVYPLSDGSETVHEVDGVTTMDQGSIRRYIVEIGSYNTSTGDETLTEDSLTQFVCPGVEQIADGLHPDFSPYYWGNSIGFLTERPVVSNQIKLRFGSDEERSVSILCPRDMGLDRDTGGTPRIRWTFVPKIGSTETHEEEIGISGATRERMKHFGIGWPNIQGFTTHSLSILNYVLIEFRQNTGYGPIIRIDYDDTGDCRNTATQVAFINTRGGWEYLRFTSRAPKQISVEGKTYRKSVANYGGNTYSYASNSAEYDTYGKTGKEQYTLQENFFDVDERAMLESLLKSPVVQIRRMDEDVWKPVTVKTNSLTIQPAGSQFYNVSLTVEIAQDIRC